NVTMIAVPIDSGVAPTETHTLSLHDALPIYVVAIERAAVGEIHQQAGEQRCIGARLQAKEQVRFAGGVGAARIDDDELRATALRSEEHTSELQSRENLVCRLLLEKKKTDIQL